MTATAPTSAASSRVPAVGEPAPDFSLKATNGEQVSLSALRGREPVLLAFFPLAFTSTCTAEVCAFSDDYDAFTGTGVRVLPVSVDSVPTLQEFKRKHDVKVEMASDFRREASRAYGVLNEEGYYSRRSYFLIDRQGIVRWVHVETKSGVKRENAELLAEIAKLGS